MDREGVRFDASFGDDWLNAEGRELYICYGCRAVSASFWT